MEELISMWSVPRYCEQGTKSVVGSERGSLKRGLEPEAEE
jgi:hypothetical protein